MPPAHPDTMKTAMVEAQRLTQLTGQEWTLFTNDQQLYQIAMHVCWEDNATFSKLVPRLGGMHMLMSFVGCIGYLMTETVLSEIMKSTFAGVPKMLTGKKFPQNIRALRLVVEELLRPLLLDPDVQSMAQLKAKLDQYRAMSMTAKQWVDCLIQPILIILLFVRAEREGDWPLHLLAVEEMMPYFFASAHFNYARYGLLYLRSMQHLHPTLLKRFMAGEHVMHHTDWLWNGIWSDLFIESTYMRYGHGPSGIIGSTLSETTLAVWALSHNTMGQMSNDVAELCTHQDHVVMRHKEERPIRITYDSRDRHVIREAIASCINVFDVGKHPENTVLDIFTRRVIDDPAVNVSNAVEIGICQMRA